MLQHCTAITILDIVHRLVSYFKLYFGVRDQLYLLGPAEQVTPGEGDNELSEKLCFKHKRDCG
jgi:hypothetical protein